MNAYIVFDTLNLSKLTEPQLSIMVKGLCRKSEIDIAAKVIRDNRNYILSQAGFNG